jgi:uncharacterized protein (DUF58 family)
VRRLSRLPLPTRRGALAGAAATVLVLVVPAPWGLVAWSLLVVAAVAVDGLLAPRPSQVAVYRSLPSAVRLGAGAELVWILRNPLDRALVVELADELAPSLGATRRRDRLRIPPRGEARRRVPLRPTRRGRFEPERLTVRVEGPLGLAARQAERDLPGRIDVHPAFPSRDAVALRLDRDRVAEVGLRAARGRAGGTEFASLREYRQGDEYRRVDWAATARAGTPIVRTYRPERNQSLVLLLDTGRVSAGLVTGVPRLDHGMDAVLALTTAGLRLGDRVGLVAFGGSVLRTVPGSTRPAQLGRTTRAMFELEPELTESDYAGAFAHTVATFRRRALLVLLTDLGSGAVADTLLPALPILLRRHLVVVAGVEDPEVDAPHAALPEHAEDAYRVGARLRLTSARRHAEEALRARGAVVVSGPPDLLAGRLVDHYLEVKAAGRL